MPRQVTARPPGRCVFLLQPELKIRLRTDIPVYWHDVVPYCSLRTCQLFELIQGRAAAPSPHAAWQASLPAFSLRTVYRWLAKWRDLTAHVRANLVRIAEPPGKIDGKADLMTLRHLLSAFPHVPPRRTSRALSGGHYRTGFLDNSPAEGPHPLPCHHKQS